MSGVPMDAGTECYAWVVGYLSDDSTEPDTLSLWVSPSGVPAARAAPAERSPPGQIHHVPARSAPRVLAFHAAESRAGKPMLECLIRALGPHRKHPPGLE